MIAAVLYDRVAAASSTPKAKPAASVPKQAPAGAERHVHRARRLRDTREHAWGEIMMGRYVVVGAQKCIRASSTTRRCVTQRRNDLVMRDMRASR